MAFYLRLNDVPELRGFPPDARASIVRRCFEQVGQLPCSSASGCLIALIIPFSSIVTYPVLLGVMWGIGLRGSAPGIAIAGTLITAGLLALILHSRMIAADRANLRAGIAAYTINERFPICPSCDYDLRGPPGDACPECGTAVRVHPIADRAQCGK